jgi:[acyl-carrier-protein] S-malonyltransferase
MSAFFFPGQGSQTVGMLHSLSEQFPIIQSTFAEASEAIGVELWQLAQAGPEAELNRTENTQPVLLAAGVAVYRAWLASGGLPASVMAGHSLGEYSALVCAGALELADAARLVRLRGRLMQQAVGEGVGAMAAVLNAELDVIEAACADAAQGEVIAPANLNAPGQIVISGHATALELMQPAADAMAVALADVAIRLPSTPVVQNVSAAPAADVAALRAALVAQLCGRVRWIESVQAVVARGINKGYECGPGKALSGMCKRIASDFECLPLGDSSAFAAARAAT